MPPRIMTNGLILFCFCLAGLLLPPADALAQPNRCREHVLRMARIVIQYQKTTEKLAQAEETLEALESRDEALSPEEQAQFAEVRSQVIEETNRQRDLFSAIQRKSRHVTEFCSE